MSSGLDPALRARLYKRFASAENFGLWLARHDEPAPESVPAPELRELAIVNRDGRPDTVLTPPGGVPEDEAASIYRTYRDTIDRADGVTMATIWMKERYLPGDLDPMTGRPKPGVMAPGLYCEDLAGFRTLQRGARTRGRPMEPTGFGPARYDGTPVFVATPEQAEFFRANARKGPPPKPTSESDELRTIFQERMRVLGMPVDGIEVGTPN